MARSETGKFFQEREARACVVIEGSPAAAASRNGLTIGSPPLFSVLLRVEDRTEIVRAPSQRIHYKRLRVSADQPSRSELRAYLASA
jgi:hypothetical protein